MKSYDWNKLNAKKKVEISKEKPIFVCGPVDMSEKRIVQLIKQLAQKRKVLFGILKDEYIPELKGEQFRSLSLEKILEVLDKVTPPNPISRGGVPSLERELPKSQTSNLQLLTYYHRDWNFVLSELDFSAVILVNGSWARQLHFRKELWTIIEKKVPYKLVSRFYDLNEAKEFSEFFKPLRPTDTSPLIKGEAGWGVVADQNNFTIVDQVASNSFDWTFQIGAILVRDGKVLVSAHNKIVPFETYTMHNGSSREKAFTPQNDQNNYDAVHAEVELILNALKNKIDIKDATLYINVLPCPSCAKMICDSEIKEIVYRLDHSDGYAIKLLTEAGKIVRRVI